MCIIQNLFYFVHENKFEIFILNVIGNRVTKKKKNNTIFTE